MHIMYLMILFRILSFGRLHIFNACVRCPDHLSSKAPIFGVHELASYLLELHARKWSKTMGKGCGARDEQNGLQPQALSQSPKPIT